MFESGEDFLIKYLTAAQQRALFSSITKYMINSLYDLANEILGKDSPPEEKKKLTTEIIKAKISILRKKTWTSLFSFLDAKNWK